MNEGPIQGCHQSPRGDVLLKAVKRSSLDFTVDLKSCIGALKGSTSRRTGSSSLKKCQMSKMPKGRSFGCGADSEEAWSSEQRHCLVVLLPNMLGEPRLFYVFCKQRFP